MPEVAQVFSLNATKHEYEQLAYEEIRRALSDSFIAKPEEFVTHFGCRPEDLSGAQLRAYYPHFLAQDLPLISSDKGFCRRFLEGRLF